MEPQLFKLGRPNKLSRNLEMVHLAYQSKMSLTAIAKQYGISVGRASHIIKDNWNKYLENRDKKSGDKKGS